MAARRARIDPPDAPQLARLLDTISAERLLTRPEWEEVRLDNPDLVLAEASGAHLTSVRIDGGDIGDAVLPDLTLEDCLIAGASATNLRAPRAVLRRVALQQLRLTGIDLSGAELRDVTFAGCRGDLMSLGRANLLDVAFEDSVLRDGDLRGASFERVTFTRCDLSGVDFTGARFKRCEVRDCRLDSIIGVQALAGVAMPAVDMIDNAALFARALGIVQLDQ